MDSMARGRANRNMRKFVGLRREVKVGLGAALRKWKKRPKAEQCEYAQGDDLEDETSYQKDFAEGFHAARNSGGGSSTTCTWRVRDMMSQKMRKNLYALGSK